MPSEPPAQACLGREDESERGRRWLAQLLNLPWVLLSSVCFLSSAMQHKDGGSPASQQKGLFLFTANNFQETVTPPCFHLGSPVGG